MSVPDMPDPAGSIAIIGMQCRFPGANGSAEFWRNLRDGVESITFFSDQELDAEGIDEATLKAPNYVKAAGIIDDVDLFDAEFFGFSPKEAMHIDPQHRLFLECSWHALEDAGYNPYEYPGAIGVFAGTRMSTYYVNYMSSDLREYGSALFLQSHIGTDRDHLCTRVAYKLNLRGPSFNLQCACSTSLVAVHLACESLLSEQSDMALAGASGIDVPQRHGYFYQEGMIFSPDGHCRPFDAQAQGIVSGNGVGVVVLKRLQDALRDHDAIHAVIRGSAINNDGWSKVAYTAPSVEGQSAVIAEALALARVDPDTIAYVEAHGTGTHLGDPLEVEALTRAFSAESNRTGYCALGSVKSNVGHLEVAAGVASLIKTVLALRHGQIPPTLHFTEPNPRIEFDRTPFFVNDRLREWPRGDHPRRACVSSFGVGGTNAHVVLEEAPAPEPGSGDATSASQLLLLSACHRQSLVRLAERYRDFLVENPDVDLADCCFTSQVGRAHHAHRLALTADSVAEMREQLQAVLDNGAAGSADRPEVPKDYQARVGFLFTGQGAQYAGMGRQLYDCQPTFRRALERCAGILDSLLPQPLLSVMFAEHSPERIDDTTFTQPALFALEYALAEMWRSWGIAPQALIGHSIGEYVAACLAGVFSLEHALKLVAARGRMIGALPRGGAMAAVFSDERLVRELVAEVGPEVCIAAVNTPRQVVVSGCEDAVERLCRRCRAAAVKARRLTVSHAFHSHLMEPMLADFGRVAATVSFAAPRLPVISNVTGEVADAQLLCRPEYWTEHVRQEVRFADGMRALHDLQCDVVLEIGPGRALVAMGRQCLDDEKLCWLGSLRRGRPEWRQVQESLGTLYVRHAALDWSAIRHEEGRRRVHLPLYPFQGERHWVDEGASLLRPQAAQPAATTRVAPSYDDLWQSVVDGAREWAQNSSDRPDGASYAAHERQVNELCAAYVARALHQLGAFADQEARYDVPELCARLSAPARYRQLLKRLLDGLVDCGLLVREDDCYGGLQPGGSRLVSEVEQLLTAQPDARR